MAKRWVYPSTIKANGVLHRLGLWQSRDEALLAQDRASLHFKLERPLHFARQARRLGPLSPEGLRKLVREQVRATRASRFVGVYRSRPKNTWVAMIRIDSKMVSLGSYGEDEDAAGRAVDQASRFLGRTPPNFPKRALPPKSPEQLRMVQRVLRGTSQYFGVTRRAHPERPWFFQIKLPKGQFAIGGYKTDALAALAHDRAVLHYRLALPVNFPARAKKVGAADIETLRREVQRTRKGGCSSRYRGVAWQPARSRWVVTIRAKGAVHFVGYFRDELEAARAYDAAARRFLRSAATPRLNFP
jgi:hypothetical protein